MARMNEQGWTRVPAAALSVSFLVLAAAGCNLVELRSEGPPVERFRIDYRAPDLPEDLSRLGVSVRFCDMGAACDYCSDAMVLVGEDGRLTAASTHRWSQPPGMLLPDMIARDLLASGLVRGVDRGTPGTSDYLVDGYVWEFGGRETNGGWSAVIDVLFVFSRDHPGGSTERTWRNHRVAVPLGEDGFDGLSSAMSAAVRSLSGAVMTDLLHWISEDPGASPRP